MTRDERRLARHLTIAVVVKLVLLVLLWWFFMRGQRVSVDAERAAARIGVTAPITIEGASQ